jgi:tetratricopeptide (TPR) repeat protein
MAEVERQKGNPFDPEESSGDEMSSAAATPQPSSTPSASGEVSEFSIQLENSEEATNFSPTTESASTELPPDTVIIPTPEAVSTELLPDTVVIPTPEAVNTQPALETVTLPPDTATPDPIPLSPAKEAILTRLVEASFPTRVTQPPEATVPPVRRSGVEASSPTSTTVVSLPSQVVNLPGQRGMTSSSPKAERANTLKALIIPAMLLVVLGGTLLAFASQKDWFSLPGISRQAVDPDKASNLLKEGAAELRRGAYEQAIDRYDESIRFNPKAYQSYLGRGLARHRVGRLREAEADYDRAIAMLKELKPLTGATSTASRNLNEILAQTYNNRSHVRYDRDNFAGAEEDANAAIDLKETLAVAYVNRANARSRTGDPKGAIQDYNRVLQLNPDRGLLAAVYTNLGNVQVSLNQFQSAIQNYGKALRIQSNYADALYNRALAYQTSKNQSRALADMRHAATLYGNQGNVEMQQRATDIARDWEQTVQPPAQPTNSAQS